MLTSAHCLQREYEWTLARDLGMPSESRSESPPVQPAPHLTPAVAGKRGTHWMLQALFWVAISALLPLVLLLISAAIGALGANEY